MTYPFSQIHKFTNDPMFCFFFFWENQLIISLSITFVIFEKKQFSRLEDSSNFLIFQTNMYYSLIMVAANWIFWSWSWIFESGSHREKRILVLVTELSHESASCSRGLLPPFQKPGRAFTDNSKQSIQSVSGSALYTRHEYSSSFRSRGARNGNSDGSK